MNLLSVHKFCLHNNCSCHFDANELKIQDIPTGRLLYQGSCENGVYPIYLKFQFKLPSFTHPPITSAQFASQFTSAQYASHSTFNINRSSDNVLHVAISFLEHSDVFKCTSSVPSHYRHCLSGKMHQLLFVRSNFQSKSPLELIHCDVWGPTPVVFVNDFKYYLVFVVDYTKFVWVYLLKLKSNVFHIFKFFKATVENQLNLKIKNFRSDGGGEFLYIAFVEFCSSQGIIHQFLVNTHLSKMVLLKGNTGISLSAPLLCYLSPNFPFLIGFMQLQLTLSIDFPHLIYIINHLRSCNFNLLYT